MEPAESIEPIEPAPETPEASQGMEASEANVGAGATVTTGLWPTTPAAPPSYERHDFRQPAFLSSGQLRKLRLWHEEFLKGLAARLSLYLRLETKLQLSKLEALTYNNFIQGLPSPSCVTPFKAEPLRGIGVLNIPLRLGLTIVDRLLGGPARGVNLDRHLSEIETALLDQIIGLVLGEWCARWKEHQELRPMILGHETNGQFLQSADPDTVMLVLALEAKVGDCTEQIQLGFPCSALEPMVSRLNKSLNSGAQIPSPAAAQSLRWNPNLNDLTLSVTAEWTGIEITVREVARLKPGDLLELSPESVNQVQVRLGGTAKFVGRLGTRDKRWGIEITQVLTNQRPVA